MIITVCLTFILVDWLTEVTHSWSCLIAFGWYHSFPFVVTDWVRFFSSKCNNCMLHVRSYLARSSGFDKSSVFEFCERF